MDPFCHYHRYSYIKIRFSAYPNIRFLNPQPLSYLLFSPSISGFSRISFLFSIFFPEDWQLHSKFYFRTSGYLPSLFKFPFKMCFSHSFSRSVKIIDFLFRNRFRFVSYRSKDFLSQFSWDQALDLLVSVNCTHCCASISDLSTLSSARGLTTFRYGISYLEASFTLRCFQRLSQPHTATLPCRWRDNRCTVGAFIPVLSY